MNQFQTTFKPLLLIAALLWAQVVYGVHDAESLNSDHQHSSECIVCLSEKLTSTDVDSTVFTIAWLSNAAPYFIAGSDAPARFYRHQPIRAPPPLR